MTTLYLITSLSFFCVYPFSLAVPLITQHVPILIKSSHRSPQVSSTVISFLGSILSFPVFRLVSYIHMSW